MMDIKIYQSKDDLNKRIEFSKITTYMEKFINKKVSKYIQFKKLKLIKMWIVITKNLGYEKTFSLPFRFFRRFICES